MIVPEDRVKYARKNGATFYFYLRPLKHCKMNRKCERHTSELVLRLLGVLGFPLKMQRPQWDTNPKG